MAKETIHVHLTEAEAKEGICEKCGGKISLTGNTDMNTIYTCRMCGKTETFITKTGKRKEVNVWDRYL